jgi:hypothetical protein
MKEIEEIWDGASCGLYGCKFIYDNVIVSQPLATATLCYDVCEHVFLRTMLRYFTMDCCLVWFSEWVKTGGSSRV